MTAEVVPQLRTRPKVLVIEDERRLRELLTDVIPQMGFPTRAVRSAEDASAALLEEPAEILLLDLHLPGQSGLDFLAALRTKGHRPEVIIMTAYGDLETARKAIRHDVADFLTKPAPLGEIEAALDRARKRLDERWAHSLSSAPAIEAPGTHSGLPLAETERREILAALERHNGNRTAAAAELGISRRTLHYRLAEYKDQGLL